MALPTLTKGVEKNGNSKALNCIRFIEELGSGLKRVNEVLGEYGIKKVAVDDAGFAVRMNVYRNTTTGGEVADSRKVIKEYMSEKVDTTVNDSIVDIVRNNPGIRRPSLLELFTTINPSRKHRSYSAHPRILGTAGEKIDGYSR